MSILNPTHKGVSFEREIHRLEESLILQALIAADGSLLEAARYLQLRSEDALKFILRRHPSLRNMVGVSLKTDQGQDRKEGLVVAALVQ